MPELAGFETINIANTAAGLGAHTGFSDWAPDATALNLTRSSNAIEVNDIDYGQTTISLVSTNQNVTLAGTTDDASITLSGVTAGTLIVEDATAATLNVTADSELDDIGNGDLTDLVITGSGSFTLGATTEALTSIDASGNTGGITLVDVDATATSVTGTAEDDVVDVSGALDFATDDVALDGGDGDDTLSIDTNVVDGDGVTNFETIELVVSGLSYATTAIADVTTIRVATPGANNGAANNDTATISAYDGSAAIEITDVNVADDTEAETINLDIGIAENFGEGTADELTVGIVTTQDGGNAGQAYIVADIDVDDEAVGNENIETLNVNISGTRDVTITNIDLDQQGTATTVNIVSSVDVTVSDIDFNTITSGDDLGNTINFAGSTGDVTLSIKDDDYDADDVITGGAGDDTLVIATIGNLTIAPTLSGFETIRIGDSSNANATLDLADATDYSTIELNAVSTAALTIDNVASGTVIAVTDENDGDAINIDGATAGSSLTVTFADADEYDGNEAFVLGAEFTTVTFEVDEDSADVDEIDVDFEAAASLTINITGNDSTDDTLVGVFDFTSTVASIAINSEVALTVDFSADTLEDDITIDFSGSTGDVALTIASADLALSDTTIIGGAGEDDTLTVSLGATTNAATVSGFENIVVSDSNAGTLDISALEGATSFTLDAETGALTITNGTTDLELAFSASAGQDAVSVDGADNTANGNTLTLVFTSADAANSDDVTVTDYENIVVSTTVNVTSLDLTAATDDADTVTFTGSGNVTLAAAADLTGAETIDLSALEGSFDTTDSGAFAADADIILGSDNVDVDLDLAAGSSQTITFGSTLEAGEVVTIAGFAAGDGVATAADILDLSALGVTSLDDLTFTDNGADVEITSAEFDGMIVLVGVLTADLVAANIDFGG